MENNTLDFIFNYISFSPFDPVVIQAQDSFDDAFLPCNYVFIQ